MKKIILFMIFLLCITFVSSYSEYGKPTEFGNLTTTTCWIGGDYGVLNCTGNGTFGQNLNVSNTIYANEVIANNFIGNISGIVNDSNSTWYRDTINDYTLLRYGDKVGIGTIAPGGKFHVNSTSQNLFERTGSGTDSTKDVLRILWRTSLDMVDGFGPVLGFRNADNGTGATNIAKIKAVRDGADDEGALIFSTGTATIDDMIIKANGNVGIGTITPNSKLEVNATGNDVYITTALNEGWNITSSSQNIAGLGTMPILKANGFNGGADIGGIYGSLNILKDNSNPVLNNARITLCGDEGALVSCTQQGTFTYNNNTNIIQYEINQAGGIHAFDKGILGYGDLTVAGDTTLIGDLLVNGSTFYVNSSSDNIGIGTLTPEIKLDIALGILRIQDSTGNPTTGEGLEIQHNPVTNISELLSYDRSASAYLPLEFRASKIIFEEAGTDVMTIDGGNVGIGTDSPEEILHVSETDTLPTIIIERVDAVMGGNVGVGRLNFQGGEDGSEERVASLSAHVPNGNTWNDTSSPTELRWTVTSEDATQSSVVMTLNKDGYLGIGDDTPDKKLEVAEALTGSDGSHANQPTLRLTQTADTDYDIGDIHSEIQFYTEDAGGTGFPGVQAYIRTETTRGNDIGNPDAGIQFGVSAGNGLSAVDAMMIEVGGNVGIGTTDPSYKLDILSTTDEAPLFRVTSDDADTFIINENGYVGIRTDPTYLFDLYAAGFSPSATMQLMGFEGGDARFRFISDQSDNNADDWDMINAASDNTFSFRNYATGSWTEVLTLESTGNVGINIEDPEEILHIADSAVNTKQIIDTYSTSTERSQLALRKSDSATIGTIAQTDHADILGQIIMNGVNSVPAFDTGFQMFARQDGAATGTGVPTEFIMQTDSGTGLNSNQFVLSADAEVGFGIADPLDSLHIENNNAGSGIILQRTDAVVSTGNLIGRIRFYGGEDGSEGKVGAINVFSETGWTATSSPTYMSFDTTATGSATSTEAMRIDSTGKLGIGTTTPNTNLEIGDTDLGTIGSTGLQVASSTESSQIRLGQSTTGRAILNWVYDATVADARFRIWTPEGQDLTLQETGGGNVGIGTTTPNYKLEVNGDFKADNITLSNGGVIGGNATCVFIYSPNGSERFEVCNT